jgi:hypothetical protein
LQAGDEAGGLVTALRGHFGDAETFPRLVVEKQIGEGAADIDAYDAGHRKKLFFLKKMAPRPG